MKVKTSELSGAALDWAVARCEGIKLNEGNTLSNDCDAYAPSTDWSQGGPIIEREGIDLQYQGGETDVWAADIFNADSMIYGNTPLVAAMRCYVASKLGDEVEVPDELAKHHAA